MAMQYSADSSVRAGVAITTTFTVSCYRHDCQWRHRRQHLGGGHIRQVGGGTGNPATLDGTMMVRDFDWSFKSATAGNYTVFLSNPTGGPAAGLSAPSVNLTSSVVWLQWTMATENGLE